MYGTHGICKITEITEKDFMGTKKKYYVLKKYCFNIKFNDMLKK